MKLYLVRHAQSKRNARQESEEDAELSEDGKEQANRLGSYFHNVELDKIYCSTLKRARTTFAEIKPYVKDIKVVYTPKIIEHKIGIYARGGKDDWGKYSKEASKQGIPFHLFKPKYGESLFETYKRAGDFYRYLLKKHKKENVLLIGHGIFSLYLILNALELDLSEGKYYNLNNASVSTLEINEKGKVKDFHINDYNHLIREGMKRNGIGK